MIPKPGKDSSEIGNNRPISLINNNLKLLTKILANCLTSFIASYIHKDQVGFIPGQKGPDQIRRGIDVVSLFQSGWDGGHPQEGFLLSIDLQKAFDMISWPYMFSVLDVWGFGPHFLKILQAMYSSRQTQVRLQGQLSPPFSIA